MEDLKISPPRTWGRATVQTACPLDCPDSCSLNVTVERGRVVEIGPGAGAPSTDGYICGKVRRFDKRLYSDERVLHPAVRKGPKGRSNFEPVTWDEALDLIATKMREARDRLGAESVLPFHYGGSNGLLTNDLEDARFFRRFGASRLDRTFCAAPTGAAAAALYGRMAGVAYDDYEAARLIVIWGCNASATGIHLVSHIKQAQKDGARLVVIDPRRTPLARIADLHLPVRPGTDLPVALALIRELFARGWADLEFLSRHADGVESLRAAAGDWTIERAAEEAGVDPAALSMLAEWYGTTSPAVIRCGWGQERNRNGGSSSLAILALPTIAGKFGVRGGGYTMSNSSAWGITAETLIDEPKPPTRLVNMNHLGRALTEYADPAVAVLYVYNCNPLATAPDQNRVRQGLMRDDLFTIVHEQVMTDTALFADVLLPATTFLEQYDIAKGYGAYHLHLVQPVIAPVGEARPNNEVFRDLGARLDLYAGDDDLGETGALLETVARLPEALSAALMQGTQPVAPGGGRPVQFVDVSPLTPDGKVHLFPASIEATHGLYTYQPDPATAEYPLALISPASEHTVSSTLGELRPGIARLKLHPDDAHPRAIGDGDPVRVFNAGGHVHCEASVTPEIRQGTVSLPKGLWARSTFNGSTSNALVPDTLSDIAGGACYNDARVQVELAGRH
ncbi:MAG: molybdopterin-dependent oxidoreductase [Vicinamibacterales bacterium]